MLAVLTTSLSQTQIKYRVKAEKNAGSELLLHTEYISRKTLRILYLKTHARSQTAFLSIERAGTTGTCSKIPHQGSLPEPH